MTSRRHALAGLLLVASAAGASGESLPAAPPAEVPEPRSLDGAELAARPPSARVLLASAAGASGESLPAAPPAEVPEPRSLDGAELAARPPSARVLLDGLVPLGKGAGNAAEFLAALRPGAPGHGEWKAALLRAHEVDLGLDRGAALPVDDPLLRAAAGWMDQAHCSFFEGVVPFEGWDTWRPDEELVLLFARSWAAEARATGSPEPARRAARLGRLLLQEGAWSDLKRSGHRAVLLGVNELRRQASRGGRWAAAIAALSALREAQALWLRSTWQAREQERSRIRRLDEGLDLGGSLNAAALEADLETGGIARLGAVAVVWQASGDPRVDEVVRDQAASLLERWSKSRDPVVARAAGWCARTAWSSEHARLGVSPPETLARARRSPEDPIEGWLMGDVPPCTAYEPPPPREADRSAAARSVGARPPELARLDAASVRAILDRLEWWDRGEGVRWHVLPVDDPFVLACEGWLLAGGGAWPEPEGPRERRELERLEIVAWRSLLARVARLAGTPPAERAAGAVRRMARSRPDGSWWSGWRWMHLADVLVWHELAAGRPEAAQAAAEDALAAGLSWMWHWELGWAVGEIERRHLHRGFLGFGPARAPIVEADLDVLRELASERCEHEVRMRAAEGLYFVKNVGSWGQRRDAKQLLADLVKDDHPAVAARAAELLEREFTTGRRDLDTELADAAGEVEDTVRSWFGR